MSNGNQEEPVLQGTPPTHEESFYFEWGAETLKRNLTFTNEILRQCLTISLTLSGGSIAFLDRAVVPPLFKVIATILFLVAVITALIGVLPYEGVVDLRRPNAIREHKARAFEHKRCLLNTTAILLFAGLFVAFIGFICHLISP